MDTIYKPVGDRKDDLCYNFLTGDCVQAGSSFCYPKTLLLKK